VHDVAACRRLHAGCGAALIALASRLLGSSAEVSSRNTGITHKRMLLVCMLPDYAILGLLSDDVALLNIYKRNTHCLPRSFFCTRWRIKVNW
jgi:hypothetical protein